MAPPKPEQIVALLRELACVVDAKGRPIGDRDPKGGDRLDGIVVELERAFRWLEPLSHAQSERKGERVGGGTGPVSGGPTAAVGLSGKGERILGGRRVTTLHASTQDKVRRDLEQAARLVRDMVGAGRGAARFLARAFDAIDAEVGHTSSEFFDAVPRQEEPDELDRIRAAQLRRTERGEVFAEDARPRATDHERHAFKRQVVDRRDWRGDKLTVVVCRRCGESAAHPLHDLEASA